MDLSTIVRREMHAPLAWLGRLFPWFEVEDAGDKRSRIHVNYDKITNAPGYAQHAKFLVPILSAFRVREQLLVIGIDAFSALLADGPKLFEPTEEQFDSMQHVDIHVPVADYRQPYPAMVVKIPPASRRRLALEVGMDPGKCPEVVVVRSRNGSPTDRNYITVLQNWGDGTDQTHFFQDRAEFADLEEAVRSRVLRSVDDGRHHDFAERSGRACLNLMLMLAHYGHRDGGPLNPREYEKHRQKKHLEHLSHGDYTTVRMVQEVVVRRVEGGPHDPGEPTGREMHPHWRRGHWRRQHHGPKNSLVKTVFVNPVLVRGDRVVGDLSESNTTYLGR